METIKEDYCSYETSKLLKEKGFDWKCNSHYWAQDIDTLRYSDYPQNWNCASDDWYSRPTHQMAMKWLREVHKLACIVSPQWAEGDMRNPCRWYWEVKGLKDITTDVYGNPLCDSYEGACEAACIYALKNLI